MKRWLWWTVIGLFLAFIFVGYGVTKRVETAKSYKSALELGQAYVNDGNYVAAKVSFQDALKKKSNDKTAKVYLEQTKCYEKGLDQIEDKQYSKARTSFQRVASKNYGLGILVKRASEKQMELGSIRVGNSLALCQLTNQTLAIFSEANYGRGQTGAFLVSNNSRFAAFHYSNNRVSST